MTPFATTGLSLFIMALFAGLFVTIFSFPGTVIIVIDVFLYALVTGFERIGIKILLLLVLLSLVAEALNFFLGMAGGATRFGSSLKGMWATAFGSCIGAAVITPLLLGLGTLLGIFLGGFTGLILFEMLQQSRMKPALRLPPISILGAIAATFVKGGAAIAMIIVTLLNVYS